MRRVLTTKVWIGACGGMTQYQVVSQPPTLGYLTISKHWCCNNFQSRVTDYVYDAGTKMVNAKDAVVEATGNAAESVSTKASELKASASEKAGTASANANEYFNGPSS